MDCGGSLPRRSAAKTGAQRRHRFPSVRLHPKAAWRFASRRSPKSVVAAQAALGLSVVKMEALPPGEITPPPKNCFATGSPRKSLPPSPGYGGQVAPCDGRPTPLTNSGLVFSGPGFLSVPFVSFCSRSIGDRRDACATLGTVPQRGTGPAFALLLRRGRHQTSNSATARAGIQL